MITLSGGKPLNNRSEVEIMKKVTRYAVYYKKSWGNILYAVCDTPAAAYERVLLLKWCAGLAAFARPVVGW